MLLRIPITDEWDINEREFWRLKFKFYKLGFTLALKNGQNQMRKIEKFKEELHQYRSLCCH